MGWKLLMGDGALLAKVTMWKTLKNGRHIRIKSCVITVLTLIIRVSSVRVTLRILPFHRGHGVLSWAWVWVWAWAWAWEMLAQDHLIRLAHKWWRQIRHTADSHFSHSVICNQHRLWGLWHTHTPLFKANKQQTWLIIVWLYHTHKHTHIHASEHTYINMHSYTHMHTYTHIYPHIFDTHTHRLWTTSLLALTVHQRWKWRHSARVGTLAYGGQC